ncbi:isoaspartyl peptidase/L-asparaginase family protein [Chitinimonas taiwanensis]|uniref:isoaspartyl peptidase/L-asparaginase family protein n=1 Tax=Chitinimonas taiwanensis TaxID=240412 RepID=UPI0035B3E74D
MAEPTRTTSPCLAIHGGAGTITRALLGPAQEAEYRAALAEALTAGYALLQQGASSLDAVVAAVQVLEDCPLFNAGRGAVFTHNGLIELDASVMDGRSGLAGAVAGVRHIRNPVLAARRVMEQSRHVLLIGEGAEQFALAQGLAFEAPAYFHTERRWQQLQQARAQSAVLLDHSAPGAAGAVFEIALNDHKYGTVGAVALDAAGNLAAATSTGGLTNKQFGRVGDTPIIGAGCYAENGVVAVSGTGTGEFFMRGVLAYDIAARIKHQQQDLPSAVEQTLDSCLRQRGGEGGVISLDAQGQVYFGFNTEGMYRGQISASGLQVEIYHA